MTNTLSVNTLISWILAHQILATTLTWLVFSAAVDSLATPTATSSGFYTWFFKFTNMVAMNLSKLTVQAPASVPSQPVQVPPTAPLYKL